MKIGPGYICSKEGVGSEHFQIIYTNLLCKPEVMMEDIIIYIFSGLCSRYCLSWF